MAKDEADQIRELCLDSNQTVQQLFDVAWRRYKIAEKDLESAKKNLNDWMVLNPTELFSMDPSPVLHRLNQDVLYKEKLSNTAWSEVKGFMSQLSVNQELLNLLQQLVQGQEKLVEKLVENLTASQEKIIADLQKVNDSLHFLTCNHSTNSLTTAALGETVMARLETDKLIIDAEIVENEDPFWSDEVQDTSNSFENEAEFDVFMTPIFDNVLNCFDMVFVNSKKLPWLPQSADKGTSLQPDGFATHRGMYRVREEPNDKINRPKGYRFGVAEKELFDCLVLFESKLTIDSAAFGQVVRYLENLNPKDAACAVLFDRISFWLIKSHCTTITKVVRSKWAHNGSKNLFHNFIADNRSAWIERLSHACKAFNVEVEEGNAFLGRGAYGRVFRVKRENGVFALKIVEPDSGILLEQEEKALKKAETTNLTIKTIDKGIFVDGIGAALLLSPVGEPLPPPKSLHDVSQLYNMLHELHELKVVHGDPRIPNIICSDKKLIWIDLAESADTNVLFQKRDFVILTRSILGLHNRCPLDNGVMEMISMYARSNTMENLFAIITKVFQKLGH